MPHNFTLGLCQDLETDWKNKGRELDLYVIFNYFLKIWNN